VCYNGRNICSCFQSWSISPGPLIAIFQPNINRYYCNQHHPTQPTSTNLNQYQLYYISRNYYHTASRVASLKLYSARYTKRRGFSLYKVYTTQSTTSYFRMLVADSNRPTSQQLLVETDWYSSKGYIFILTHGCRYHQPWPNH
jgi:hypothetical protein